MKKCTRCKEEKNSSEFQKRAMSRDGLTSACKKCLSGYDKSRALLPHRVQARKNYLNTEKGRASSGRAKKRWAESNVVKRAAHIILGNALRSGGIVKLDKCEECGSDKKLHGHHDDYSQPLGVRWLCTKCHTEWHKRNEPIGF